jgi:hypothetical protein
MLRLMIDAMNIIAREGAEQAEGTIKELQDVIVTQQSTEIVEPEVLERADPVRIQEEIQDTGDEEPPELEDQDGNESDDEAEDDAKGDDAEEKEDLAEQEGPVTTRSGREVKRPSRFVGAMKVARSRCTEKHASDAIKAELQQLFVDLKALHPVKKESIKKDTKVLNSHMFLVEKHLANGEYDKTKGRIIVDGRDQDPELFPNKSSPTVSIQSVFTVLGLVATINWLIVVKIDIKGAFLQMPMTGEPIYMHLDPKFFGFAIQLFPEMEAMLDTDGCIYTQMLKAMHGCVHTSALWYEEIKKELLGMGYVASPTDKCVFRKWVGDRIFYLLLYADDILELVDKEEAVKIGERLRKRFGEIVFEVEKKNYHISGWRLR